MYKLRQGNDSTGGETVALPVEAGKENAVAQVGIQHGGFALQVRLNHECLQVIHCIFPFLRRISGTPKEHTAASSGSETPSARSTDSASAEIKGAASMTCRIMTSHRISLRLGSSRRRDPAKDMSRPSANVHRHASALKAKKWSPSR